MNGLIRGAAAGCSATFPMTLVMDAWLKELPQQEQYPLPPRPVAIGALQSIGAAERMTDSERSTATIVGHFTMGTAAGACFGIVKDYIPLPAGIKGPAFGLAVWAANYAGIIPGLGLLSPPTRHPLRRTLLMIGAHLVWGGVTGMLAQPSRGQSNGHRK